jgi:hypothetical protein
VRIESVPVLRNNSSASLWTITLAARIIVTDHNLAAEEYLGHDTMHGPAPLYMGFFAQPPDRVYSRDSTNRTHVEVPLVAKIKMTTYN